MKPEELLSVLHTANRLKDTTRHCWTPENRHESVADHSWRLALTAFFLRDEFPDTDMDKVIKMCLIHDLGECFTGDIPSFLKTDGGRPPDSMGRDAAPALPCGDGRPVRGDGRAGDAGGQAL